MDVSCERCRTEYEFDDALLSERGTSVRCTNCSFEFKLFPSEERSSAPEVWKVISPNAGEAPPRVFESLNELQWAIRQGEVKGEDLLIRGQEEPRALESIVELQPLLRRSSAPPPRNRSSEPPSVSAPPSSSEKSPPSPPRQRIQSALSMRAIGDEDVPSSRKGRAPSSPALRLSLPPLRSSLPARASLSEPVPSTPISSLPPPLPRQPRAAKPPQINPEIRSAPPPASFPYEAPAPFSSAPALSRRRRAGSGWMIAVVLLGAAGFVAWSTREQWRGWLGELTSNSVEIAGEGPAVITVELEKNLRLAELDWWRLRLLPEQEPRWSEAKGALAERLSWLSLAVQGKDKSPSLASARVDLLRMQGDIADARRLLSDQSASPRPYSLALLDLLDESGVPPWASIRLRLQEASSGEGRDHLATSALIYVLSVSGQLEEAEARLHELGESKGGSEAPLYAELVRFVERRAAEVSSEGGAQADVEMPPVELESQADNGAPGENAQKEAEPASATRVNKEVEQLVAQADMLWGSGSREEALTLYRRVVKQVGKTHFLGQRARARIAQAEREQISTGD